MKDLNLIPQRLIIERRRKQINKLSLSVFVGVIAVLCVAILIPTIIINRLEAEKTLVSGEIEKLKYVTDKENELIAARNDIAIKDSVTTDLKSKEDHIREMLKDIHSMMPKKIVVSSISIDSDSISFSGKAENEMVIADLISNIRASGKYSDFFIPDITPVKDGSGIAISLKIKYIGQGV